MTVHAITILCLMGAFICYLGWNIWREHQAEKQQKKEKEARDAQTKQNTNAKESMDTGNGSADFAASLDVLSKLKK